MNKQSPLDSVNQKTYAKAKVLDYYDGLNELFPAEKVLFEKLSAKIKNSKILDIGVGGGRTTKYLLPLAADYTGIDYVPEFIKRVKRKHESGKFLVGDARNLKEFADESFDFALFSYNGIDVVSHEDRLKVLKEIYRVLKTGGTFMFSSHNRDYRHFKKPYWMNDFRLNAALVKNVLSFLFFQPRHWRMKQYEVYTDEYAIINDSDHRYSLLIYYIRVAAQIKQLEEIGFFNIEVYNIRGEPVKTDAETFCFYYLANK
ncbi:MAG: class I SAM-dependent methyltransferase [Acidobacteriota bacterium]|nr:class I SAM-dependent methyltransferase [Acidobacteriota bacterium]